MADYFTPFIQGFRLRQQANQFEQEHKLAQQQAAELNAYRQQQAEQLQVENALGFLKGGNVQAAQQVYDKFLAPKYGPATLNRIPGKGDILTDRNGNLWNVDAENGTITPIRAQGPAAVVGSIPGSNVMAQGEGPISTEAIEQPRFPVQGTKEVQRPMTVAPGATVISPTGEVLYKAPAAPEKPQAPRSVPPGGTLVDPNTGKIIYQAPPAPQSASSETAHIGQLIARLQKTRDQLVKEQPPFYASDAERNKWKTRLAELDKQIAREQERMGKATGSTGSKEGTLDELEKSGLFGGPRK